MNLHMNSHKDSESGIATPIPTQKRVLIIDDDPDITMTLSKALKENGFKTDSYTDPVEVYKNFRKGLYDLVLLDIKMQVVDGFLLYQKIRETDSRVKLCFLTATEFYYEQIRKQHGFDDFKQDSFLRKPIEIKDLVHALKKLLESK
jgi:DNA-binding response OmpR family regulator